MSGKLPDIHIEMIMICLAAAIFPICPIVGKE